MANYFHAMFHDCHVTIMLLIVRHPLKQISTTAQKSVKIVKIKNVLCVPYAERSPSPCCLCNEAAECFLISSPT